tara:strand:+ start:986 stop:1174 length:189 start_codon:yes stop_codon:yes gene_type:complete
MFVDKQIPYIYLDWIERLIIPYLYGNTLNYSDDLFLSDSRKTESVYSSSAINGLDLPKGLSI